MDKISRAVITIFLVIFVVSTCDADTRSIRIDKATRQILSVGDLTVTDSASEVLIPFDGVLPQDTDVTINIQDYRLGTDNKTLTKNPAGNISKARRREAETNKSITKAFIKFLANHHGMTPQQVKEEIKSYLEEQ